MSVIKNGYAYSPDLQEMIGGAIHGASNYPDLLLGCQDVAVHLKFLFRFFSCMKI